MSERVAMLRRAGKHEEALQIIEQTLVSATEERENPFIHFDRALSYEALERLPEALASYSEAIRLDPKYSAAFNNRGAIYARSEQLDKALSDFNMAVELDRTDALAYRNRGLVMLDRKKFEEAFADFSTAIRINGDLPALLGLGDLAAAQGEWKTAIDRYTDVLTEDAQFVDALVGRSKAYRELGQAAAADADMRAARAMDAEAVDELLKASKHTGPDTAPPAEEASDDPTVAAVREFLTGQGLTQVAPDAHSSVWINAVEQTEPVRVFIKERPAGASQLTFTGAEYAALAATGGRVDLVIVDATADARTVSKRLPRWNIKQAELKPTVFEFTLP